MQSKVILFQGDSITDAGRSREVEISKLANTDLGAGYPSLVAARLLLDFAKKDLQFHNRGISGNRVTDLYSRWKRDALNYKPDIISILIGVNDSWHGFNADNPNGVELPRYERFYRELLQWTLQELPEVKLVLLEPFVFDLPNILPDMVVEVKQRAEIVKKLSKEFDTIFVPFQEVLDKYSKIKEKSFWLRDGVHPTLAGHQILADAWLEACRKLF